MNSLFESLNLWGARSLHSALSMLLQSSLLIVVLLLLDLALERYARAVVRYGLWLLVLVKLVLPPSLALPTGIGYWLDAGRQRSVQQALPATTVLRFTEAIAVEGEPKFSPLPAGPTLGPAAWGLLAWFAGSLALFGILVRRSRDVARRVAEAVEAPAQLQELLNSCCRQMGIRQTPALKLAGFATSPAACGLLRPVILIPEELVNKLSMPSLRAVLFHELAHIKQGDVWLNYLQTLLQIVYWYHPLLWLANAQIRRVREQAVDEIVMGEMGEDAETYPATLLQVAKTCFARAKLSLGLVGIVESGSALAQRLKRLVNRPIPTTSRLTMANVLLCLLAGAALLPMAHGQRNDKILTSATKVDPETIEGTAALQATITSLRTKIADTKQALANQIRGEGDDHPNVAKLRSLLAQLEAELKTVLVNGTRQEAQSQNSMTITIAKDSRVYLESQPVLLGNLQQELEAAVNRNPRVVVSVRADRESSLDTIARVMEAAKAANIKQATLITDSKLKVVIVEGKFLAATSFQMIELGTPNSTNRNGTSTWSLSPEQLNAFLGRAEKQPRFHILGAPRITTTDGQEAAVYTGQVTDGALSGDTQHASEPIEESGGPIFSVNAIGYVSVRGTNTKGEVSRAPNLIGPALKVLPRVIDSAIEVVVNAQVTEAVLKDEPGNKRSTSASRPETRTNFLAEARVLIPNRGNVVIANSNFRDAKGIKILLLLSTTLSEADSSNGSSPE